MVLPAPNLDDRGFQDLVDDAKRLVQQRCPGWTDHNVSDPGVTLIEAFAQMVDQLIYRLNRVPDRHYVKFLELIGVEMRPPSAARGMVTFWLSAPQPQTVVVRAETEVATPRTDVADPVVFTTERELNIVPCSYALAGAMPVDGRGVNHSSDLQSGQEFDCFQATPQAGDALLVGLSNAVPSCAVVIRMDCRVMGIGVNPDDPPLIWEAWTGSGWTACELDRDDTGGMNIAGDVILHVPENHQASTIVGNKRAGWLRCRLLAPKKDQATYQESPKIKSLSAFTIGGTARMRHAQVIRGEDIGSSDGTPAQRFALQRHPVVPWDEPGMLQVIDETGVTDWAPVENFAECTGDDKVFHIDASSGELHLGPAVRQGDGTLRQYGAIPTKGAHLRLAVYRTGGGSRGNVAAGQVRVLKTSVPYVARVENRTPAVGGASGEDIEDAKLRGPLVLRSRGRAVTAEDFVELAKQEAPEIARVHCIGADGGVRVLVVPHIVRDDIGRIRREDLTPFPETLERVKGYLDERRLVGTRMVIEPPEYQGVTAVISVRARPRYRAVDVKREVQLAIYRLFDPLVGGPEGTGWPLGRAVQAHEVNAALARIPGVDMADEVSVRLFPADATTGERGATALRLPLAPTALVFSYEHQVRVRE